MTALSESLEEIFDDAIPDRFNLCFATTVSPKRAAETWGPLVTAFLPVVITLSMASEHSFTRDSLKQAIASFRSTSLMARGTNVLTIDAFTKRLKLQP